MWKNICFYYMVAVCTAPNIQGMTISCLAESGMQRPMYPKATLRRKKLKRRPKGQCSLVEQELRATGSEGDCESDGGCDRPMDRSNSALGALTSWELPSERLLSSSISAGALLSSVRSLLQGSSDSNEGRKLKNCEFWWRLFMFLVFKHVFKRQLTNA
jgi:hypothetical protein